MRGRRKPRASGVDGGDVGGISAASGLMVDGRPDENLFWQEGRTPP